jgi:hypothetical protein
MEDEYSWKGIRLGGSATGCARPTRHHVGREEEVEREREGGREGGSGGDGGGVCRRIDDGRGDERVRERRGDEIF